MLIDTFNLQLGQYGERWKQNGRIYVHADLFMLRDFALHEQQFLIPSQPYLLREGRVVLVRKGEARYSFNLVEHCFRAGDLVVFSADTLVEKQGHSADFQFDAFNFPAPTSTNPEAPSYICLHLNEQTQPVVEQHFALIWQLVQETPTFPEDNVRLLTASLLEYVRIQNAEPSTSRPVNRRDELLRRFVSLVSRFAARERTVSFYANKLCLAPHYLSTLIKEVSGQTVMQWINQTCVKEIKVWLAYSDDSAAEIAHRLNFPCPASLTKFFKRETGLTPSGFRHKVQENHLTV